MVKYVNYGHPILGTHMYLITMYKTGFSNYKVEVLPCDIHGNVVSDAVAWDLFDSWFMARRYVRKQYKEFYRYVNSGL